MRKLLLITALVFIFGCNTQMNDDKNIAEVSESTLANHIEQLASDEFMGRKPSTEGEDKTVNYLAEEFSKLGLLPGNGDSYFQEVPMIEITGKPSEKMIVSGPNANFEFTLSQDFVATSDKAVPEVSLDESKLIFAGYGIIAPEYGWNDYEGIDWEGKTAVVLINDPGFQSGDSTLFKGNEMTYYGRWTYKYEEAARQGASGVIIIHETEPASYGWNVVQSGWSGAQFLIESESPVIDVNSWISGEAAQKIMNATALKGEDLRVLARNVDFKPIPLDLKVSIKIENTIRRAVSKNVVALFPGNERKDETIIYSAHWDHFGIGEPIDGDSIYNGAVDNATGTASLLAIAEAFKNSDPVQRSVVFMALTGEEQGLLGSTYYAEHPIFDPAKTVANINMDGFNSPEPMKDLTIIGYGQSELDEYAKTVADKQGRYLIPDPHPERGYFYRSDHFNFAKIGIPALYAQGTYEGFSKTPKEIEEWNNNYELNMYHQPTDEYDPETFILSGVQFDAQLLFEVGFNLASEDYFPKWNEGSEFKAVREADD